LRALHLNLDGAWRDELSLPVIEAGDWGARLRFSAPPDIVESFYAEIGSQLTPFVLYGSGDFHYLTGLFLRRLNQPCVLVSFDNHPDWDIRPPRWGCGGWINRALELAQIQRAAIWGCGNFECWWPHNIFANRKAEREGRLDVYPWTDDRPTKDRHRRGAILRESWREKFEGFVSTLGGHNVYVTIDLDCLRIEDAVTNWENGRFTVGDLEWALEKVRGRGRIAAGDICGAYSEPKYARWKQKFASEWDHPKLNLPNPDKIRTTNSATLARLWPALTH
jgi:arginase family enzyme